MWVYVHPSVFYVRTNQFFDRAAVLHFLSPHSKEYCIRSFTLLLDFEALNEPRFYLNANDSVIFCSLFFFFIVVEDGNIGGDKYLHTHSNSTIFSFV
jgi:hypothetical protein